mgnify:CR=1 FL=1
MKLTDLRDFITCYHPENRHARQVSERFKCYRYEELVARDKTSLNIFWRRACRRAGICTVYAQMLFDHPGIYTDLQDEVNTMNTEAILQKAQERARAAGKRHAGDLTPEEAHAVLRKHPKAILVDVRSHPELDFSGFVEGCCHVPWQLLLCRTGGRSLAAAEHLADLGYGHCYNILGGLEGKPDTHGQRGKVEGWKASGLPWKHK